VAKKGIDPPTPYDLQGQPFPQTPSEALSNELQSHSGSSLAQNPFPVCQLSRVNLAP